MKKKPLTVSKSTPLRLVPNCDNRAIPSHYDPKAGRQLEITFNALRGMLQIKEILEGVTFTSADIWRIINDKKLLSEETL